MIQILYSILFIMILSFPNHAEVLDKQGNPSSQVQQIIKKFHLYLKSAKNIDSDIKSKIDSESILSTQELNHIAQKFFLRPKGFGRSSPGAHAHYKNICASLNDKDQQELIELFKTIGDIDTVYPSNIHAQPDYILIQGATVPNMRQRVMFLADLITTGQLRLKKSTQIIFYLVKDLYTIQKPMMC
ncbi:MAG: hypothetical protein ACRYGR_05055 [Janthinobacterium lividum]